TEDWEVALTAAGEDINDGSQRIVPLSGKPFQTASDFDGTTDINANSQALRIAHAEPGFTVTSITARRDWELDPFTLDIDFSPVPGNRVFIKRDEEQWSEELRMQSAPDVYPWRWRGGFFFSTLDQNGNDTRNFLVPNPAPPPPAFGESQRT